MFNATVLDHFHSPRNAGPLEEATHQGTAGVVGDGPYLRLWFRVEQHGEEQKIVQAAYQTYPCPAAVAAGSIVAEIASGRTVKQMLSLTAADIVALLRGLPEGKEHCAELAVAALANALSAYARQENAQATRRETA